MKIQTKLKILYWFSHLDLIIGILWLVYIDAMIVMPIVLIVTSLIAQAETRRYKERGQIFDLIKSHFSEKSNRVN